MSWHRLVSKLCFAVSFALLAIALLAATLSAAGQAASVAPATGKLLSMQSAN